VRIAVTGSSGRIGRAVCACLVGEHAVVGIDRVASASTHTVGDIGNEALLRQALQGADAVVHCAALHAPHVGALPDSEFERINVQATQTLARVATEQGVTRFVFTSTTALYGAASTPVDAAGWVDEALVPQPKTIYHRSKLAAEAVLEDTAARGGMAVTVLRMARCFPEPAPRMAVYRLHRGVDARDVARAHVLALTNPQPGFRCFVVSGATPFVPDDAQALWHDAPAVIAQRAPALARAFAQRGWSLPARIDRVYASARATALLGWQPRFGFDEVLRQFDAAAPEVLP
jgi:UDP-glucose 4-epimerase